MLSSDLYTQKVSNFCFMMDMPIVTSCDSKKEKCSFFNFCTISFKLSNQAIMLT